MSTCRVCTQPLLKEAFSHQILGKYLAHYFHCGNCDFLQTENPYWLPEAYTSAINLSDTGLVSRNISLAKLSQTVISKFFNSKAKFIDYAAGYGLFTRIMRDAGYDCYWEDPYCDNILAKGFEREKADTSTFELLTTFECFEHLAQPNDEIKKMLALSSNILFSTVLRSVGNIPSLDWWYYGFKHGQHVAFYSAKTLDFIAKSNNLHYNSFGSFHLFSTKPISNFWFRLYLKLTKWGLGNLITSKLNSLTVADSESFQ